MSQSEIKIFYSWQSDLPGNQTRSVIQESIESVVKTMKDTNTSSIIKYISSEKPITSSLGLYFEIYIPPPINPTTRTTNKR